MRSFPKSPLLQILSSANVFVCVNASGRVFVCVYLCLCLCVNLCVYVHVCAMCDVCLDGFVCEYFLVWISV